MLLNEKFRPKEFEDVLGLNTSLKNLNLQTIPHFLFCGSPGIGKTTVAKIIINKLKADALVLNASDERGIDVIREKVKTFASTQSRNGNIKIVFLDEADHLTIDSQTCLRNLMETYSNNCRFILTCNYINKIIEPIQSRCIKIEFGNIKKEEIIDRLEVICKKENINYELGALKEIVKRNGDDIRKAINKLEELKDGGITLNKLINEIKLAEEIFNDLRSKKFLDARQKFLDKKPEPEQFLKDFYAVVFNSGMKPENKKLIIFEIAECYRWLGMVAWKEILIENMMLKVIDKC